MRTYWGPRSLNEKWVPEQTRIMLIGIVDDARPREVNIDAAKKTASGLARALKRKQVRVFLLRSGFRVHLVNGSEQVDFTEVESSKDGNVVDLFTTIGNGVALRMLTQVTGQLKKVNASALQTKAMLRKTGFSEEFTSRNKLGMITRAPGCIPSYLIRPCWRRTVMRVHDRPERRPGTGGAPRW